MASLACCHGPPATRTSTASMPLCWAQATPAMEIRLPALIGFWPVGTSMRDSVLIGAWESQPRGTQYACAAS